MTLGRRLDGDIPRVLGIDEAGGSSRKSLMTKYEKGCVGQDLNLGTTKDQTFPGT